MRDLAALAVEMDPEDFAAWCAALDPADLAVVEQAVADHLGEGWRSTPAAFGAHFDPSFQRYRYVELLSQKFVDAVEGRSTRQVWNLPGRYGKTTLLRYGLAWGLERAGGSRWLWVSYGDDLALETGAWLLAFLKANAQSLRATLRRDRAARDRFWTPEGGGAMFAGLDTSIFGFGCGDGGGLILDDPFKNWQEAHSAARRKHVANQFRGTLRHRLDQEEAPIIVCHHRLHEDDLTGDLVKAMEDETGEAWEVVSLPAIAPEVRRDGRPDPLGREPGEPLEPKRFTVEQIRSRWRGMSSYLVAALEQQQPAPEEGNDLLRSWFQLEEHMPTRADEAITSWDLKLKNRDEGDYVVGQCWWRVAGGFWLVDQLRGQWDHATTANAIALLAVRHPEVKMHVVEAAASSDEVLPKLKQPQRGYVVSDEQASKLGMNDVERAAVQRLRRRGMSGIKPENVTDGAKPVRARTFIAPNAEAGDVHLPAHASWVPHLLDELAAFPNGTHDDQVDAMSQALKRLGRPTTARASTGARRSLQPPMKQTARPTSTTGAAPVRSVGRVSVGSSRPVRR